MTNVIEIVVSGKNEAKAAIAEAKADSEGLSGTLGKLGMVGGAALVGIAAEAVKMAASYQSSTTRLVTSAGESAANLDMVRKGMLNMAGQVGTSAEDLSKGMYTVESAGYHATDALTVLKASAQGAKDENADLGKVANAVTDVLVDYHLKASDAADVTSKMVTAVSFGKTTFDDFSGSMHNILPLASAMHLSFADVAGVLAEMTAHGMSADQASQNMANAMRSLIAPTTKQTNEFAALGTSAQEVRDKLSTVGLAGTMQFLAETAKRVGPNVLDQEAALKKLMGTAPGLSVALMTTGENFASTTQAIKGISSASADAQGNVKGFSEIQGTLAFKVSQAKASFGALMIELGDKLIPVLTDVMNWMNKNHDVVVKVVEVVGTLVAVLAAYALGAKVAAAASALFEAATWLLNAALDANPIVLIGMAIIALGVGLYELLTHWKTVWAEVKKVASEVGKFLSKLWGDVKDEALRVWASIVGGLRAVWDSLTDAWNASGGKVVTAISNAWDTVSKAVSGEWDHIYADLSSIWNNLLELWNDTGGHLVPMIESSFEVIVSVVKGAWTMINGYTEAAFRVLTGFIKAGWDTVTGVFKIAWDVIGGVVKVAWDLIGGYVKSTIDLIEGVLKAAWDSIIGTVKIAWDMIKGAINTPLDFIKDLFQLFMDFVTGHWGKLWNDVHKTASDLWHNIYGTIKSILGDLANVVGKVAGDIWNGFIKSAADALKGIGKAAGDIKNAVVNVFKDAVNWLYQAGKDIIQGLINGIGDMAGSVGSALGSIASSVGNAVNPVNWFRAAGGEVGGAASGGVRSGLTMVGEHGPELVRLPTGSTVRSNPDTMAALAGASGGGGPVALEWIGPDGPDELFTLFKRWIRVHYGNDPNSVQKALGQTF